MHWLRFIHVSPQANWLKLVNDSLQAMPKLYLIYSAWKSGPVWFFGPKGQDQDWDQSWHFLKLKKTRPGPKKTETAVFFGQSQSFLVFRCQGLNWVLAGSDQFLTE